MIPIPCRPGPMAAGHAGPAEPLPGRRRWPGAPRPVVPVGPSRLRPAAPRHCTAPSLLDQPRRPPVLPECAAGGSVRPLLPFRRHAGRPPGMRRASGSGGRGWHCRPSASPTTACWAGGRGTAGGVSSRRRRRMRTLAMARRCLETTLLPGWLRQVPQLKRRHCEATCLAFHPPRVFSRSLQLWVIWFFGLQSSLFESFEYGQ